MRPGSTRVTAPRQLQKSWRTLCSTDPFFPVIRGQREARPVRAPTQGFGLLASVGAQSGNRRDPVFPPAAYPPELSASGGEESSQGCGVGAVRGWAVWGCATSDERRRKGVERKTSEEGRE